MTARIGNHSAWKQHCAEVLRRRIGRGMPISTADAAVATEVSDDTIDNYKAATVPDADWLWLATRNMDAAFVQEVWGRFFAGSEYQLVRVTDYDRDELDHNKDGRVDLADAIGHAADATRAGLDAVEHVRTDPGARGDAERTIERGKQCFDKAKQSMRIAPATVRRQA